MSARYGEDDMTQLDAPATMALLDGRYQLIDQVGHGGMAQVYRAEDLLLGRTVAIKMMRGDADVLASPARARNEMTALASLNHPSLVKLFDGCIVPGRPGYLVMEFVEGDTLADVIRQASLTSADVAHLAVELASALHTVHEAGIVHRDVKPSNILLTPTLTPGRSYHAKLADFGVAYLLDSDRLTSPGTVVGTAAYLAPEQVRGDAAAPAADIYALGLVLLEALTGERAFAQVSGIGAVMARLVESPHIPAELGPEWTRLLTAMTATDPAHRPTAAQLVESAHRLAARAPATRLLPAAPVAVAPPATRRSLSAATSIDASPDHTAPARPRSRGARRPRAGAIVASAAAAAVLAVHIGIWAGAAGGDTPRVGTAVPVVADRLDRSLTEQPPSELGSGPDTLPPTVVPASDIGGAGEADAAAQRAANSPAPGGSASNDPHAPDVAAENGVQDQQGPEEAAKQPENATENAAPGPAKQAEEARKKAAEQAAKNAEKERKAAEKAAEQAAKKAEEAAKKAQEAQAERGNRG
jgi:hypothetical protein